MIANTGHYYPKQFVSIDEKLKVSKGKVVPDFIEKNYLYWRQQQVGLVGQLHELQKIQESVEGNVSKNTYSYVENPLNSKNPNYKKFPAKLRNYDIITPVIERFVGERIDRPDTQQVYATGDDVVNEYKIARDQYFDNVIAQEYINQLNALGVNTQVETKDIPGWENIEKNFESSFLQSRSIEGNNAFNYLKDNLLLDEKEVEAFTYWLRFGRVYTYKDIRNNDVSYEVCHPLDVTTFGWDTRYAEDAAANILTRQYTVSTIIDNWGKELVARYGDTIIEELERYQDTSVTTSHGRVVNEQFVYDGEGYRYSRNQGTLLEVQHIYWKSIAKRGILTYINEFGMVDTDIVDDTYKLNKEAGDLEIEWIPENEVWEIVALNKTGFSGVTMATDSKKEAAKGDYIFLSYGPILAQRNQINNTSSCKGPINGTYFGLDASVVDSVWLRGQPYQELYNIFHYRFELTMAKNKDKLMLFPLGLIPSNKGWDIERWMYQIHAFSIAFFDETSNKAAAAIQAMKDIDLSLSQYMRDMWTFMNGIKDEWWDSIGMNRQRYGDINTSDGKGTTQQAVYRSSVSTQYLNFQFDKFLDTEALGLIDYSKLAWIDGKKGMLIAGANERIIMQIDPVSYTSTEYGIFSTNSMEAYENVQVLKNTLLQAMAQNGTPDSILVGILETNNIQKIKELAKEGERIQAEQEQALAKQQQDAAQRLAETTEGIEDKRNATKIKVAEIQAASRERAMLLTADSFNAAQGDADNDGVDESAEIYQRYYDNLLKTEQQDEAARSNRANEDLERKKLAADIYKVDTQKEIAKTNKNRYDK